MLRVKKQSSWFLTACAIEFSLGIAAIAIDFFTLESILAALRWNFIDAALGLASAFPLLALFIWSLRTSPRFLRPIRQSLDTSIRPLFDQWSVLELATISAIAGFSEELFFRGLIQGNIVSMLGPHGAAAVASLIFGAFHLVNGQYAVITGIVGLYLGELWILNGNLLLPMVTHGFYDFIALVYFMRIHPKTTAA